MVNYQRLFEDSFLPAFILQDGYLQLFNRRFLEYLGYKELSKIHFYLLVHQKDRQKINEYLQKVLKEESVTNYCEFRFLARGGHILHVYGLFSKTIFKGRPAVIAQVVEITEYKKAMDDLQNAEARYKDLFENINDIVYTHDLEEERFITVNKAFERMLGLKHEDITSKYWKNFLCPSVRHLSSGYLETLRRNGYFRGIACFINAAGDKCYLDVNTVVRQEEGGKIARGIARNVTDFIMSKKRYVLLCEGITTAMARLVEYRDPYTAGHQKRVAEIAVNIGDVLGFSKKDIKLLHTAAILHDVGKIAVPVEILTKPITLTSLERKFIDLHPEKGREILKEIPFPEDIAEVVVQHHERLDGSGYPAGLTGNQILLPARIIAVADVFEAMISHRPYRPAFSVKEALKELISNSGVLYDRDAVEALVGLVKKGVLRS